MKYNRSKKDTTTNKKNKRTAAAIDAFNAEVGDLDFEEEPTTEGIDFLSLLTLLYGSVKIGKTTTASKFPGGYFLPTEPGYRALNCRKTPIKNWNSFTKFIKIMEKSPKKVKSVKVWIIDTVDNLAKFCMDFVCGRDEIAHPSDAEWGKGWEAWRDEFTRWIMRLINLGNGVVFISHSVTREVVSRSMKIDKTMPALPKTCYTIINNLVDRILFMDYYRKVKSKKSSKYIPGETRCVFCRPSEDFEAGDRTGLLPRSIPFLTEKELVDKLLQYSK